MSRRPLSATARRHRHYVMGLSRPIAQAALADLLARAPRRSDDPEGWWIRARIAALRAYLAYLDSPYG